MPKNIVYCADGTWDSSANNTNVYRMFKACLTNSSQVPYYDDGVGSDGAPLEKLLGGAFGTGLFQKIKDGYTKISLVYEAGDQIFLFGFSRGAYTARSLAGMIAACGLPTKDFNDGLVETAFRAYRNKDQRATLLAELKDCNMDNAVIHMVGVWDTVGSLGIPAIFGGVSPLIYGFLDTSLNPRVANAYQALAIDERRAEFPASVWTVTPQPGQTVEQVWFTGVHCDVGGGYPENGLSTVTYAWMLSKAVALGLQVDPTVLAQFQIIDGKNALDQKHESWNPVWLLPKNRSIGPTSAISNSVSLRLEHDGTYRPRNLQLNGDDLADTYSDIVIVKV